MKRRFTAVADRPAPGTQAVLRAVAILKALGSARAQRGLSELASELDLHKTTVFRLLGALEREGFVARDAERESYQLGAGLIALGTQALRSIDVHAAAHPVLGALAALTGEAATLDVLVGENEVLILDEVHGRFLVGSKPEIGMRWPAHVASTGKVLLAAALPSLPRGRLAKMASNSITSRAALERELTIVASQGFSVASDEAEHGFTAIGVAVRNHEGRVSAAISLGGPTSRFSPSRITELVSSVREAADQISARLGAPIASASNGSALSRVRAPARRTAPHRSNYHA